jgi:hypothetical protein
LRYALRYTALVAFALVAIATAGFAAETKTFEPPEFVDGKKVVWQAASQIAESVFAKTTVPVNDLPTLWVGLDNEGSIWMSGYTANLEALFGAISIKRLVPGKETRYRYIGANMATFFPSGLDLYWVESVNDNNLFATTRVGRIKRPGQFEIQVLVYLFEYEVELEYTFHLSYPLPAPDPDTGGPKG